jgi:predicted nucleic acid-binding protein
MPADRVLYWDASAILSALIADAHTAPARTALDDGSHHLVSSLAAAETLAVLGRIEREDRASGVAAAREGFLRGRWRWTRIVPETPVTASLAARHRLRGADLWHLAAALTLRERLPELRLLTFDLALRDASQAEGLGAG